MIKDILSRIAAPASVIGALLGVMALSPAHAGEIWLTTDQVRAIDLEQPVASIVVGNPAIADVKVQSNTKVLFYGKAPGLTNIYFFDKDQNRIDDIDVRVQSQMEDMLVVYRGTARASYTCTRNCELTSVIGDSEETFQTVANQANTKMQGAVAAAGSD